MTAFFHSFLINKHCSRGIKSTKKKRKSCNIGKSQFFDSCISVVCLNAPNSSDLKRKRWYYLHIWSFFFII